LLEVVSSQSATAHHSRKPLPSFVTAE